MRRVDLVLGMVPHIADLPAVHRRLEEPGLETVEVVHTLPKADQSAQPEGRKLQSGWKEVGRTLALEHGLRSLSRAARRHELEDLHATGK